MAAEVIWDSPQVSSIVGLDVSTTDKPGGVAAKAKAELHDGDRTVRVSALTVAGALALLWYLGAFGLKSVRI